MSVISLTTRACTLVLPVFLVNILRGRARTILVEGQSPKDVFSIMTPTQKGNERLRSVVWPTMRNGFLRPPDLTETLLLFSTFNETTLHHGRAALHPTHPREYRPTNIHQLNLYVSCFALWTHSYKLTVNDANWEFQNKSNLHWHLVKYLWNICGQPFTPRNCSTDNREAFCIFCYKNLKLKLSDEIQW